MPVRIASERRVRAFTLIELLVVVSIVALLIAILLPSLGRARRAARSVVCQAQLQQLMSGFQTYAAANDDIVVPSYNMRGVSGSTANPYDGWAPILDRDGIVRGNDNLKNNPFVCPDTLNKPGIAFSAAGVDPDHAKGYMDWPVVITISGSFPTSIPSRHFDRIIRTGYWINGDNPTGLPRDFEQGIHFTGSVGYGPNSAGQVMVHNRFSDFERPGQLVALADGFYAGRQEATRISDDRRRIGYRHQANGPSANVAFADGHAESIAGDRFPRKPGDDVSVDDARSENLGTGPTLFAHPSRSLAQ